MTLTTEAYFLMRLSSTSIGLFYLSSCFLAYLLKAFFLLFIQFL